MAHRSFPVVDPDDDDPTVVDGSHVAPVRHLGTFSVPPAVTAARARVQAASPRFLAIGATALAVAVGWWLLRPAPPPVEASIPSAAGSDVRAASPQPSAVVVTTAPVADLVVQAAGAVASPGVYRLPPGSRVDDLVSAAGGYARGADPDRVNLAAPLGDGERVWVPHQGEEEVPSVVAGGGGGGTSSAGGVGGSDPVGGPAELVDLNTASAAELEALPGVGPATSAAIIAHRTQAGGFASVDELLDVRGIGDAKMEQLRPLVRV